MISLSFLVMIYIVAHTYTIYICTWGAIPCSTSRIRPFWPCPWDRLSLLPAPFYIVSSLFVLAHLCRSLLFIPTIHISHVHPPLTDRQRNTAIQVNIYTSHNYYYTTPSLYSTSSTLLSRPAGPDHSCREQVQLPKNLPQLHKRCRSNRFWVI